MSVMWISRLPLLWRIFLVNACLVTAFVVVLAVSPLTVSNPATSRQVALLGIGLAILLAANFALLRVSLAPLDRLTQLTRSIDLLQPGQRLRVSGASELTVVLTAFNEMLERLELERQAASTRSVAREESERRRVATELHDQVGQGLTALLLRLRSIIDATPEPLRAELLDAQAIARTNLDEIRRIARRLRPSVLDDLGLPSALLSLAEVAEDDGLVVDCHVEASPPPIGDEAELAVYRIAQEAMTNALRHAAPTRIELVYEAAPDHRHTLLAVHDDGRGMIYAPDVEHGGIRGMRERAIAVGADLVLVTRPGHGTTVSVTVPTQS